MQTVHQCCSLGCTVYSNEGFHVICKNTNKENTTSNAANELSKGKHFTWTDKKPCTIFSLCLAAPLTLRDCWRRGSSVFHSQRLSWAGTGFGLVVELYTWVMEIQMLEMTEKRNSHICAYPPSQATLHKSINLFSNNGNTTDFGPQIIFFMWMDTREMTVASTIHETFTGQVNTRKMRDKDFHSPKDHWSNSVVDLSDQLLQYHSQEKWSNQEGETEHCWSTFTASTLQYPAIPYIVNFLKQSQAMFLGSRFMKELAAGLWGATGHRANQRGGLYAKIARSLQMAYKRQRSSKSATKGCSRCIQSHVALCLMMAHRSGFPQRHKQHLPSGSRIVQCWSCI